MANHDTTSVAERETILTRTYNAPRELVFEAWTDPKHLVHWWGPKGFTITIHEMDFKVGGMWRFIMHAPNGMNFDNRTLYKKIVKPERLEYTHGSDVDKDPNAFEVTVTFTEKDGKTEVTMRTLFPTAEQRTAAIGFGAIELGQQTLDKLAEYLGI